MLRCVECGAQITPEENMNIPPDPICGICWEALHQPEENDFSDADPGL
jgi:hypothetical protein